MIRAIATGAVLFATFVVAGASLAQNPIGRPVGQPVTSPYLNLLPYRNEVPALNYYRAYRPEVEWRANQQNLNQSIRGLQREIDQTRLLEQKETSLLGTTGHRTSFHNTAAYFPSLNQRQR